jgi:hypothetical protein
MYIVSIDKKQTLDVPYNCRTQKWLRSEAAVLKTASSVAQLGTRPPRCVGVCHTRTNTRWGFSEGVISLSRRALSAQHAANARDEEPCPQRDSNPRSQESSGRKHTP